MRARFEHFMQGRYGQDELGRTLSWLAVAVLLVNMFTGLDVLYYLAIVLLAFSLFRTFSRNTYRRQQENQAFKRLGAPVARTLRLCRRMLSERKTHRYFRCPRCKQWLRVPRGKGHITVKCRICDMRFEKKT